MGSKPLSLNKDDFRSLGWTLFDVATAAMATEFIEWSAKLDSTDATLLTVLGVLTVLVKAGRKWVSDNSKRWRK